MVLTTATGGVADCGRTPTRAGDTGSQTLEFTLILPLFGIVLALLAQVVLLLGDVLVVQGVAREAARVAAVDGDASAADLADLVAGSREVRVVVERDAGAVRGPGPAGDTVVRRGRARACGCLPVRSSMTRRWPVADANVGLRHCSRRSSVGWRYCWRSCRWSSAAACGRSRHRRPVGSVCGPIR